MPEEDASCMPADALLTNSELQQLVSVFAALGVTKVRITGGEPVLRPEIVRFIRSLKEYPAIRELHLTSNGVDTWKYLDRLKDAGLSGINFSLDTLDPGRFLRFTRRDALSSVLRSIREAVASSLPVRINAVIQAGKNFDEIIPLAELARELPVQVRFLEQMSFNGLPGTVADPITTEMIFSTLEQEYPDLESFRQESGTATGYAVPGFSGSLGIISGHSRTFCSLCDRIRVTPDGLLKTCLYDNGVVSLRDMLRSGAAPGNLERAIRRAVLGRYENGFIAECSLSGYRTMAAIGG